MLASKKWVLRELGDRMYNERQVQVKQIGQVREMLYALSVALGLRLKCHSDTTYTYIKRKK